MFAKAPSFLLLACCVAVSMLAASAAAVQAQAPVDDCGLADLRQSTVDARPFFLGKDAEKNQADLIRRLDDAATRLAAGKSVDAIEKLIQYQAKLAELSFQRQLNADVAAMLDDEAQDVIDCITDLP